MTNDEVAETLLFCLRQVRAEAEEISSLRHYIHVLMEIVLGGDDKLTERFRERLDELEPARRDAVQPVLSRLDGAIRKLEAAQKPRVN